MPKQKTHRGAAKRLALTKNGLVKRAKAFKRHILNKKTRKTKRNLRRTACFSELRRHDEEAHPVQVSPAGKEVFEPWQESKGRLMPIRSAGRS